MNWESFALLLAVAGFFAAFASLVAWQEVRWDRNRRARFAEPYEDYVNDAIRRALTPSR
jgi:hypothetical protein